MITVIVYIYVIIVRKSSEVEDMCYDRKRNKQACKRCVVFNACWYYWQNIKCGLPDSVAKFNRGSRFLYVSTNIYVIRYDPHSISLWLSLCDIKNGDRKSTRLNSSHVA